jgi:hypothetical protein
MSEEEEVEDYPDIGDRRNGFILVCMGDDRPDQWIDWLEELVCKYEELEALAEARELPLDAGPDYGNLLGWRDFCETLGVSMDSKFWEGCMTSGQFQMGWIQSGTIRSAKKAGKEILNKIHKNLLEGIRRAAISELEKIKDLDRLVERTLDDRVSLLTAIKELNASLVTARKTTSRLEATLAEAKAGDTSALTSDCLRMACAVLNEDRNILLAGPLVLWDDGVVYAFTSRGGEPLPADSSPSILLTELKRSGHPTVEVSEMTVIGGFLSGRCYRKGSAHISGWVNVWREVEQNRERAFLVADSGHMTTVRAIHQHFKSQPPA